MRIDNELIELNFRVNQEMRSLRVDPLKRLLDLVREDLRLTGTKEGCSEGECGACNVLVDGAVVCSCLLPAMQLQDVHVETIESFGDAHSLSALQKEMATSGGTQCGMCTPGVVVACEELLKRNPRPSHLEIREALAGNLCRCTGYTKIFDAVAKACKHYF